MNDQYSLSPPIGLFIAHAPQSVRDPWRWLWELDQRLIRLSGDVSEPMLAQIRLAWWRDQLLGAGKAPERRDPMLLTLDAFEPDVRDKLTDGAIKLVDAIEALVVNDGALPIEAAAGRGAALTLALADMAGFAPDLDEAIGRYWGLSQLGPLAAQEHGETETWQSAVREAAARVERKPDSRALSLMRLHARLIIGAKGQPLGPKAGLRLIALALSGL